MNLETVIHTLKEVKLPEPKIKEIEDKLKALAREEKDERAAQPKHKSQFVVIVSDKDNILPADMAGWVVQIPVDDDPATVIDKLKGAVKTFNATKKGQKLPIKSLGEAFESLPRKITKPINVLVKTKSLVRVLKSNNSV